MSTSLDLVELVGRLMPTGNPTGTEFNAERVGFGMGAQFEYFAEKLRAIADGAVARDERELLLDHAFGLERLAKRFQNGLFQGDVLRADREKLLLCDIQLLLTTTGSAAHQTGRWHDAVQAVVQAGFDDKRPNVSPYIVEPQS